MYYKVTADLNIVFKWLFELRPSSFKELIKCHNLQPPSNSPGPHQKFTFPVCCLFNLSALLPSLGTHLCDCNSALLRQLQLHCDPSVTLQLYPTAYTYLQFENAALLFGSEKEE